MRNPTSPMFDDGDFASGIAAAGTTAATATTLPANHCEVTTVSDGQGVIVKAYPAGEVFSVSNAGSGANLLVYPPAGASFNGKTANLPVTLPRNTACHGRFLTAAKIILLF